MKRFFYVLIFVCTRIAGLFSRGSKLYHSRFARLDELSRLLTASLKTETSLLLGIGPFNHILRVAPTAQRRELGNLLICAPTRAGKGLHATSQIVTFPHSLLINDIKGELYQQTAGYRASLGPVFCLDPTGVGHRYDPMHGKQTEDELMSLATHLLFEPREGEGKIFTERATVMLTQILLAARLEAHAPFPYVRHMIRLGLPAAAERLNNLSPVLATQFLDVEF